VADPDAFPEETWGVEDPRLTYIEEEQRWIVAYTAYSRGGPLVSLAATEDFKTFERLGAVMPPEDKDAALFPVRFGGRWALIHRCGYSISVRRGIAELFCSPLSRSSTRNLPPSFSFPGRRPDGATRNGRAPPLHGSLDGLSLVNTYPEWVTGWQQARADGDRFGGIPNDPSAPGSTEPPPLTAAA
jgi:hypothetical protein